jgi:choline kinase
MTAIILAAGVGRRLADAFGERPKCLIEVGGRSLLLRLVDGLEEVGVERIVVVAGFGAGAVRAALAGRPRVECVVNERFREGAILSLWAARAHLDGPVLVMDADVLCPVSMLRRLMQSSHESCFLLDGSSPNTGEEQMLLVRDGLVRNIVRGGEPGWELAGESVGFLKLGAVAARLLRTLLAERIEAGETGIEHEEVYPALLAREPVGYERVDGEPWTEIDFVEDVRRAEEEILPRLGGG